MGHGFDEEFWDQTWREAGTGAGSMADNPPHPQLVRETGALRPGTALDAGCGAGAEATWLASRGWQVTAVDLSSRALARAAERATADGVADRVRWVEADLTTWEPDRAFDLVTTHYAHAAMPQLHLYARISTWVAPGGTLLVVGHRPGAGPGPGHGHTHHTPDEATVTADAVTDRLDDTVWDVVTAAEVRRTLPDRDGRPVPVHDVVVRATRRR